MTITKEKFKYIVMAMMLISHSQYLFPIGSFIRRVLIVFNIASDFVPVAMTYFVVEGYYKTKSFKKYLLRLSIAGLIAVPFKAYLFGYCELTYLVSLAVCLLICLAYDKCHSNILKIFIILCLVGFNYIFCEGGINPPMVTLILLICKNKNVSILKTFVYIGLASITYSSMSVILSGSVHILIISMIIIQSISAFCAYFVVKSISLNQTQTILVKKTWSKYIPYVFYPLHFALLVFYKYVPLLLLCVLFFLWIRKIYMQQKGFTIGDILSILIPIVIAVGLLHYVILITHIASGSMEPFLNVGDIVVYNRLAYKNNDIQRGDVIAFKSDEFNELMGKRIIGLPGDVISFKNGKVIINGVELDESSYIDPDIVTSCDNSFEVPSGYVFVMGDNRENSNDSRFWKNHYISTDNIIGRYAMTIIGK